MWLAFEFLAMKEIRLSAHFVSGLIGLTLCYAISIWFLWSSQMSFAFQIDPAQSLFTRGLARLIDRDNAKVIGISLAFLSIHLSWYWRYSAGYWFEVILNRVLQKKTSITLDRNLESEGSFVEHEVDQKTKKIDSSSPVLKHLDD